MCRRVLQYHWILIRSQQAVRSEKPCEKSDGAVQRVHCGWVADNSMGQSSTGMSLVTSAPSGESEEHWDEGCLQERCIFFSCEWEKGMTWPCQGKRGAPSAILNCPFPDVSTTDALSQALIEGWGFKSKSMHWLEHRTWFGRTDIRWTWSECLITGIHRPFLWRHKWKTAQHFGLLAVREAGCPLGSVTHLSVGNRLPKSKRLQSQMI